MISQFSWKTYADLGLRILLIVLATVILTAVTESINYDLHLSIRKAQPTDPNILILEVDNLYDLKDTLEQGLLSSAKSIYLYDNTIIDKPIDKNLNFYSPDGTDASSKSLNFLFREDADGQVRRFTNLDKFQSSQSFPMGLKKNWNSRYQRDILINFRGPNLTFERGDIFGLGEAGALRFQDKTLVVFNRLNPKTVVTPLGPMDESEVIANLLDNFKNDRFIRKIGTSYQLALCGVLLILSLAIILYLPAFLALIGMTILFCLYISFSLFLFDQIYLWSPIVTPMIQILLTYVLISNYKYMLNENTKWKIERRARYAREVEEMKNNFLGLFSHDLKTPLAKVIGISETLLTDETLAENHLEEIKKIRTYSRELEKYLKRIIKTSQLQSEKVSLMKSQGDINIVIQKCINKMKPLSDEKSIRVHFEETPLFLIDFDHQLIEEVLFNFIENAIHYTPQEGIIQILASEVGDFVKVSVIDKGPGIDKNVADKVWDKFFRLETKKQGYGLGLYLSKYVIELHQGRVYLNSEPGQGSEFGFLIPISGEQND